MKTASTAIAETPFYRRADFWVLTSLILALNIPLLMGGPWQRMIFTSSTVAAGEFWRLVTHPFVHVTLYHLLLDSVAFLMLYVGLQEARWSRRLLYVVACGIGSLGAAILASAAPVIGFCGLSGIAHGLMAVGGLEVMHSRKASPNARAVGMACVAIVAIKSAIEALSGTVVFSFLHFGLVGSPVAVCHAGGVLAGILSFVILHKKRSTASRNS